MDFDVKKFGGGGGGGGERAWLLKPGALKFSMSYKIRVFKNILIHISYDTVNNTN